MVMKSTLRGHLGPRPQLGAVGKKRAHKPAVKKKTTDRPQLTTLTDRVGLDYARGNFVQSGSDDLPSLGVDRGFN